MAKPEQAGRLRPKLGLIGVVSLGAGAAIGISVFAALAPAAKLAGAGLPVAMLIAAAPMAVFAIIHAVMGSGAPATGASYAWGRAYVHPFAAFIVAWLRLASTVAAMIVLAQALVQYLSMAAPIAAPGPVIVAALLTVWALNTISVAIAARAQLLMLLVLLASLGALVVAGIPHVQAANFAPAPPQGVGGVLAAAPLLAGLFFGVEAATEMGEEVKSPASVPTGVFVALGLALALYLALAMVALGVLGPSLLADARAPVMDVAQRVLGPAGAPLVATAGAVAIGTTMNALFMILARTLVAMGRSRILPAPLATIHPKLGTPWIATTLTLLLCLGGLLLPASLVFLLVAVSVPNLLRYGLAALAALRAIGRDPALLERARPRLAKAWLLVLGWVGAGLALALIGLGWAADWRPYAALGAWTLIGAGYYLIRTAWVRPAKSS